MPDRRTTPPRWWAVAALLRARIEAREWPPGTALPAQRQLAEACSCSYGTLVAAVHALAADGMVTVAAHKGGGVYVTDPGRWRDQSPPPPPGLSTTGVVIALRNRIEHGDLRPGDALTAPQVADRHGVPVDTAKAALHRLQAIGLVAARPQSGYVVRDPDVPGGGGWLAGGEPPSEPPSDCPLIDPAVAAQVRALAAAEGVVVTRKYNELLRAALAAARPGGSS